MKILWANANLLHPTTKGGQIRTLEMLRLLNQRHEIHYVTFEDPAQPEGVRRASEYCARLHTVPRRVAPKNSPAFFWQVLAGVFSSVPVAVSRYYNPRMLRLVDDLLARESFDRAVCDHLAPASHFRDMGRCVFFRHNVETLIWRRQVEHAPDPLRRAYFKLQAKRMLEYERRACRAAGHIVAVSPVEADLMRTMFGVTRISEIPTGVNLEYFAPPSSAAHVADLVFVGSMDYLPNIDGVTYFVQEILPLIRQRRPGCSFAIVGRTPPESILDLTRQDPKIQVSGTVPDIRPYLWGSSISIVPLRIGGGTRLKIYESMAARTAIVSTTIGAEGLEVHPPDNIRLADTAAEFAAQCLELLDDPAERCRLAGAAWDMISARFSWEQVTRCFEQILTEGPQAH